MSHLVVGDNDCTFGAILTVMGECETNVRNDWRNIATVLGLTIAQQDDIEQNVQRATPLLVMQRVLITWRSSRAQNATLGVLVGALEHVQYNEMATKLKNLFNITSTTRGDGTHPGTSVGTLAASSPDFERKQQHIIDNMEVLIGYLNFNSTLSSRMRAGNILSREDIEELDAIPVRARKNKQFFMFIHDKLPGQPETYGNLVRALDDGTQSGVSGILKQVL